MIDLSLGATYGLPMWRRSILGSAMGAILLLAMGAHADSFDDGLIAAARERTTRHEIYDGAYRKIGYPLGDVPDDRGVCTDVVIRAYREVGIDLQVLLHEDMLSHFNKYPQAWGLRAPDSNIDHRRVPNLQRFFERHGKVLRVNTSARDYAPGDLVTWMLPGNLPHIGIVSDRFVQGTSRPQVFHNIGAGTVEDDTLFVYPVTGHYRFRK
jgi:uncharacterized protein